MRIPYLEPIIPGIELLRGDNNGRFPFSHSVVIRGEADAIIDVGCGLERLREVTRDWMPDLAVVSHAHPDHCAGLWLLERARKISPFEHSEMFWKFEPMSRRFAETGELASIWIGLVRETMGIEEIEGNGCFRDGDTLDFGKIRLNCIHAPGHTEDSYVFFESESGVALTFDVDLTSFGPWYGNRESDIGAFLESIDVIGRLDPKVIVSSHKGVISDDIPKRLERYAGVIGKRDDQILHVLRKPSTFEDLLDRSPILGGHPKMKPLLRYWEERMIEKHLDRLQEMGKVIREENRWRRV